MSKEKTEAIVLSRRSIGEADRQITLFSQSRGLLRVLAKGVRTVPSHRGSHLEPFTRILVLLTGGPGRYYLATAETLNYYQGLRADPNLLLRLHLIARAIIGLYGEGNPLDELYRAFRDCLEILPTCHQSKQPLIEISIYLTLLRGAGYALQLKHCQVCHHQPDTDAVVLDHNLGGWSCLSCRASLTGSTSSITPAGLKVLRYLSLYPQKALKISLDPSLVTQLEQAMQLYVSSFVATQIDGASVNNMR